MFAIVQIAEPFVVLGSFALCTVIQPTNALRHSSVSRISPLPFHRATAMHQRTSLLANPQPSHDSDYDKRSNNADANRRRPILPQHARRAFATAPLWVPHHLFHYIYHTSSRHHSPGGPPASHHVTPIRKSVAITHADRIIHLIIVASPHLRLLLSSLRRPQSARIAGSRRTD